MLAILVAAIWGSNFVVMRVALDHFPPFLLATLRFTFALLPLALFLPRPKVSTRNLAGYGFLIGTGQFGLLLFALRSDISPGLASVLIQMQVFFTIALAAPEAAKAPTTLQCGALALAGVGIVVIAVNTDGDTTTCGIVLVLAAALSWAAGNTVARRATGVNTVSYVVWSSAFAIPPLLILSCIFEGPAIVAEAIGSADTPLWFAVLWQAWGNAIFGYGAWAWLLSRHSVNLVSPVALLVPVFGLITSAIYLREPMPPVKLFGAGLLVGGLALIFLRPIRGQT